MHLFFFTIVFSELIGDFVEKITPLDNRIIQVLFTELSSLLEIGVTNEEIKISSEVIVLKLAIRR